MDLCLRLSAVILAMELKVWREGRPAAARTRREVARSPVGRELTVIDDLRALIERAVRDEQLRHQ